MSSSRSEGHAPAGDVCGLVTFAKTNVIGKCHLHKSLIIIHYTLSDDMMTFYMERKSIMCVRVYTGGYVKFTYAYIGLFKTPKCHVIMSPGKEGRRHGCR